MSILENPRANPGLGRAIFRQLATVGGAADRLTLLQTVSPPGVGWYEPGKSGDARDETLVALKALGFLAEEDGSIALALDPSDWTSGDDVGSFRRLVRRQLFLMVGAQNPFESDGLARFAGALAWWLAQDPLHPFGRWGRPTKGRDPEAVQMLNLGQARRLITNDFQWTAFMRWATFLGFAAPLRLGRPPDLVAPDPSLAIADEIGGVLANDAAQSLAALSRVLPVIDGGLIRSSVESKWRGDEPPALASPSLSAALLRLHVEGAIVLENVPDAQPATRVVLSMTGESRTVSSLIAVESHA